MFVYMIYIIIRHYCDAECLEVWQSWRAGLALKTCLFFYCDCDHVYCDIFVILCAVVNLLFIHI